MLTVLIVNYDLYAKTCLEKIENSVKIYLSQSRGVDSEAEMEELGLDLKELRPKFKSLGIFQFKN